MQPNYIENQNIYFNVYISKPGKIIFKAYDVAYQT